MNAPWIHTTLPTMAEPKATGKEVCKLNPKDTQSMNDFQTAAARCILGGGAHLGALLGHAKWDISWPSSLALGQAERIREIEPNHIEKWEEIPISSFT